MKKNYLKTFSNNHLSLATRILLSVYFLLVQSSISGCSSGDNPLPPGSSVSIQPTEKTWMVKEAKDENGVCIWSEDFYNDHPILISVTDPQGSPIGEADLTVSLDLAGNTFSPGFPRMKLYEDKNSNGVPDDPEELVSDENDPIYTGKTKKYTGEKHLILRMNLSCNYRGDIFAISDGFMGVANFSVEEITEQPDPNAQ